MTTNGVQHHISPEIVINRDPACPPERQIMLVDDYGQHIELSVEQLQKLAAVVASPYFSAIAGL